MIKIPNTKWLVIILIVITFVAYSNTLNAPFVFDDIPNIVQNPTIKDLSSFYNIDKIFEGGRIRPFFLNRFIGYLSFALNYKIFGPEPFWYHVVNIAIHLLNVIIVFLLVKTILMETPFGVGINASNEFREYLAFFVSLFFALHPIQTQAVTYIVQRFTSLATLFYLLSLLLFIKWRVRFSDLRSPVLYILSLLSLILAMRTKEIAFTLPIVIFLSDIVFIKGRVRDTILYILPFLLCMAIIPLTLISLMGLTDDIYVSNHFAISKEHYLFTQFTVVVKYISLLFMPINQVVDYDYPLYKSFFEIKVILSFILLFMLLVSALLMTFCKRFGPFIRLAGFGLLWFFITLSVESSIIPIADYIFEHRLYLPSAGFFISLVSMSCLIYTKSPKGIKSGLIVLAVFISVILFYATYSRNEVWADEERLWKDNITKQPLKARAYTNLSNYYYKKSEPQSAVDVLEDGYRLMPDDFIMNMELSLAYTANRNYDKAEGLLNRMLTKFYANKAWIYGRLGLIYLLTDEHERAYDSFVRALKNAYFNHEVWLNLSSLLYKQGEYERTLLFVKVAIINAPNDTESLLFAAHIHEKLNRYQDAEYYYKKVKAIDPEFMNNLILSGIRFLSGQSYERAKALFALAVKEEPNSSEAYYFLGLSEFKLNEFESAKLAFQKAIDLRTEYLHYAHYFLAKIYQRQGDRKSAIKHIKKAIEAKPDFELALNTLRDLER